MAQDIIGYNPCRKIDAADIDAFFCIGLDKTKPTNLTLETPWGKSVVDLTPALDAMGVGGKLELYPEELPDRLRYNKGSSVDDIMGADLSRIVLMQKLKDVVQDVELQAGDIYQYDSNDELFHPFNVSTTIETLKAALDSLSSRISNLEINYQGLAATVTQIQETLTDLEKRVEALEEGSNPPTPPEPPEVAPYGFIYYQTAEETPTENIYVLADEVEFNKLGGTSQDVELGGQTISRSSITGYNFMEYTPTTLPASFLAYSTLEHALDLPTTITTIPEQFLVHAYIKAQVTLPNTLTTIGNQFLYDADYRYTAGITLPDSLKKIGNNFFTGVFTWTKPEGYPFEVIVPEGVTSIGSFFFGGNNFRGTVAALFPPTSITIPSTVTSIGMGFMSDFSASTNLIVNTNAKPSGEEQRSLSVLYATATTPAWTAYTKGIQLSGTGAQTWKTAFPDHDGTAYTPAAGGTTEYVYRKLVVAS